MLGLCRDVFKSGLKLKKSKQEKEGGFQLSGKTVGIIGCGHIGSDVIKLLAPIECNLLVRDIVDKSNFCRDQGVSESSLEEVIEQSDLISLHVPYMVDENFLLKIKPTDFLVNTCRGEVVDQNALKKSLEKQTIAGAALDVFIGEPPTDSEFLSLPNLMVTPHIGGNAKEAVEAMGLSAINHTHFLFQ